MHMRFVRLKIKEDKIWDTRTFYEERVFSSLEGTDGCLFAGLLQSSIHEGDSISMTVWESAAAAAAYESSGLFDRLLDESDPLLQEAEEWSTDLAEGDDVVVFSGVEPEVESWDVAGEVDDDVLDRAGTGRVYVRMVAARLRKGAFREFSTRFDREVRPALAETPGCLGAFLVAGTSDDSRILSVTVWAREEDAVRYALSGEFERLTIRLKDTFSDLYQWSVALSGEPAAHELGRGRDLEVEGYELVVGRKLA